MKSLILLLREDAQILVKVFFMLHFSHGKNILFVNKKSLLPLTTEGGKFCNRIMILFPAFSMKLRKSFPAFLMICQYLRETFQGECFK